MLVYHGTNNMFTNFDYNKIGQHGTSEGQGFYFTDNKEVAAAYATNGYLLTVEYQANKPLAFTQKKITKQQLKSYFRELHKINECLWNYTDVDFVGMDFALTTAVDLEYNSATNDVDMICSICNGCGSVEDGLKTLYRVLGYDSIQTAADWGKQNLYIALVNDIIKIVDVESLKDSRRMVA